jgi:hypothetical protein
MRSGFYILTVCVIKYKKPFNILEVQNTIASGRMHAAISIKVVHEQSGKVEYER